VESLLLLSLLLSLCRPAWNKMEKTAKVMKDAIVGERKPKFGIGKKQKEMECEKVHVFMQ